jgi:hypothetical protein
MHLRNGVEGVLDTRHACATCVAEDQMASNTKSIAPGKLSIRVKKQLLVGDMD